MASHVVNSRDAAAADFPRHAACNCAHSNVCLRTQHPALVLSSAAQGPKDSGSDQSLSSPWAKVYLPQENTLCESLVWIEKGRHRSADSSAAPRHNKQPVCPRGLARLSLEWGGFTFSHPADLSSALSCFPTLALSSQWFTWPMMNPPTWSVLTTSLTQLALYPTLSRTLSRSVCPSFQEAAQGGKADTICHCQCTLAGKGGHRAGWHALRDRLFLSLLLFPICPLFQWRRCLSPATKSVFFVQQHRLPWKPVRILQSD